MCQQIRCGITSALGLFRQYRGTKAVFAIMIIGWINFIKCMRGAGLPIEALIEYVALCKEGDKTEASRKAILIEQRDILQQRIESLQKTLVKLNYKIDNYGHLNQEAIKNIKWNE